MDQVKRKNRTFSGGVFNINYHFVWTTKRRTQSLNGMVSDRLKEVFSNTAKTHGFSIEAMEVMPDHVHLFASSNTKVAPYTIVKKLKGESSNIMRKEFPQLRRMPALWSSSYYCGSIGTVSTSIVENYIKNQKGK